MDEIKDSLIENVKILLLYGNKKVDGKDKNGKVERIFKDKDDTAHYYYMEEFLKEHMQDEKEVQNVLVEKHDVNSVFYEIKNIGHIVFAENTSIPTYKTGIFYMPSKITPERRETLKKLQSQLIKEKYEILVFLNLHRDKEGILTGFQKNGDPLILDEFMKEEQER